MSGRTGEMIRKPIIVKHTEYQNLTRCLRWGCALHGHRKSSTLAGSLEPSSSEIVHFVCLSKSKRANRSYEICCHCTWVLSRRTADELPDKQIVWLWFVPQVLTSACGWYFVWVLFLLLLLFCSVILFYNFKDTISLFFIAWFPIRIRL